MSYEFNPNTAVFELPNPYTLENSALIAGGAGLALAGLISVFAARGAMTQQSKAEGVLILALAVAAMVFGLLAVFRGFAQLKFFFGRDIRALVHSAGSASAQAYTQDQIKARMREGALLYTRPSGPINGLLYALLPKLITSPGRVRELAESEFSGLVLAVAATISCGLCYLIYGSESYSIVLAMMYAIFGAVFVYRPMWSSKFERESSLTIILLVVLVLIPAFAPLALAELGIASRIHLLGTIAVLYVLLSIVALLGLLGCIGHLMAPEQIESGCDQRSVSFTGTPEAVYDELDRLLQLLWQDRMPARVLNVLKPNSGYGSAGNFSMDRFEESQPVPKRLHPQRWRETLAHPSERFVALSSALGGLLLVTSGLLILGLAFTGLRASLMIPGLFVSIIGCTALAWLAFRKSHVLWGRIEFRSTLYWIEAAGAFRSATVKLGNEYFSQMSTASQVTNVEHMTLRVWVAEVTAVGYGTEDGREIISLAGRADSARQIAQHLDQFATAQRSIIAPGSAGDMARIALVQRINSGSNPAAQALGSDVMAQAMALLGRR